MANATSKVFCISELLEQIIVHLPQSDILLLQRVNKRFRTAIQDSPSIQQKLFFKASTTVAERGSSIINPLLRRILHLAAPECDVYIKCGPLPSQQYPLYLGGKILQEVPAEGQIAVDPTTNLHGLFIDKITMRRSYSYHRMMISDPACRVQLTVYDKAAKEANGQGKQVEYEGGSMGELVRLLQKRTGHDYDYYTQWLP